MQDLELVRHNQRTRYLLTVIDILSKYAWLVGLQSKWGTAVRNALRHLLENKPAHRHPMKLQTDQGKEFYNQHVKWLLDQYDIHHYSTRGELKAAVAEQFNRTLKELTYKYIMVHNTLKYLDTLPKLLARYNQHIHSSTGRGEPPQCQGGLVTVAHHPSEASQLSTGRFRENLQVAGQGQEVRGFQSQECSGRVVMRRVHGDGSGLLLVQRC